MILRPRRLSAFSIPLLCLVFLSILLAPMLGSAPTPVATVGFSLDFPQSIPDHYVVSVSSDGRASYDSTGKLTIDAGPGEAFHLDFTISPGTRERIFDPAARAKYFVGKGDSGKRNIAPTGE